MLCFYILYKLELVLYNLRILIESSLIVIFIIKLYLELKAAFNKHTRLV